MKKEEFEALSEQEKLEELERCKDPRYFYNNYWTSNGKPVTPIGQEEWDEKMLSLEYLRHRRVPTRESAIEDLHKLPLTKSECYDKEIKR